MIKYIYNTHNGITNKYGQITNCDRIEGSRDEDGRGYGVQHVFFPALEKLF